MNGSTPGHLLHFVTRRLRLRRYLKNPGDGRPQPQIPAQALLWALLIGQILRQSSFHAVEALVRSSARRTLAIPIPFSDDTLGYFTERLDPRPTRQALLSLLRSAKRNKAFDDCRWIGLALDGTGAGWRAQHGCNLCRPKQNAAKQVLGYQHSFVMISVVGTGLSLPCDGEPYGPGDSEYAAGQRLLRRVIGNLGKRFAQYVVVDGEFATAPFLHTAGQLGLRVVARLKDNLPELLAAAQQRFPSASPTTVFQHGLDRVEVWDAEDFDPWNTLRWEMVRVFFYRQHKPDGKVVEAYWLTNFPSSTVGPQALFRMAKSRWEIENQGFNEAKSRHGLEHICHHHANSLLIEWLLAMLALTIDRVPPQQLTPAEKLHVPLFPHPIAPHRHALTEAATSTEKTCLKIGPSVAPSHRVTNPAWILTFFSGILNGSEIAAGIVAACSRQSVEDIIRAWTTRKLRGSCGRPLTCCKSMERLSGATGVTRRPRI